MVNSAILANHADIHIIVKSEIITASNAASNFYLAAAKEDVFNYAREGSDLIIEFTNGEQLVIRDFFLHGEKHNNLVFSDGNKLWLADFTQAHAEEGSAGEGDRLDDADIVYRQISDSALDSVAVMLGMLGALAAIKNVVDSKDMHVSSAAMNMTPPAPPPVEPPKMPAQPELPRVMDKTGSITGEIRPGDVTDETLPDFSGTGEAGSTIIIADKGVILAEVKVDESGNWVWTPTQPLPAGEHIITATAKDGAGNESVPSPDMDFEVNTTAPDAVATIVSITEDTGLAGDFITSDQTLTIKGGTSQPPGAGERVQIRLDDGYWQEVTEFDPSTGNWNYDVPQLGEGNHKIEVRIIDKAGNISQMARQDITIDVTAPDAVATIVSITEDTGLAGDFITSDQTLVIHGKIDVPLQAGEKVQVRIGDGNWHDVAIKGTRWDYDHTGTPLADGNYLIETRTIDQAGNVTAGSQQRVTIDTQGSDSGNSNAAVTLQGYLDDVGTIQGANTTSGSHTDDPQPVLYGTVKLDALGDYVEVMMRDASDSSGSWIFLGKAVLDTTQTDWSFPVGAGLADGTYQFKAVVCDRAGNEGLASNEFIITIDTAAPVAINEALLDLYDDVGFIQGTIVHGSDTDDSVPTYSGSAGSVDANDVVSINIYDNNVLLGSTLVNADGSWAFEPAPPLAAGQHVLTARPVDAAGNEGAATKGWDFSLLGAAPAAPLLDQVYDNQNPVEGIVQKGAVTNDATPIVSGTAAPLTVVHIFVTRPDGSIYDAGHVKVAGNGTWSIELPALVAGDGSYIFRARAVDGAGQESPMSGDYPIILDMTAPSIPARPTVTDNVGENRGIVTSGSVIDDNRPIISGNAGAGEAGGTATVYVDGVAIGAPVVIGSDGLWSLRPDAALTDGAHKVTVRITDVAGNVSRISPAFNLKVDTSRVVVSVDGFEDNVGTIKGPVTITGFDGVLRTDDATPQMKGSANPDSIIVVSYVNAQGQKIIFGQTVSDAQGNWSLTPALPLEDGSYSFTVEATNLTGNKDTATASLVIDTKAPDIVIEEVQDDVGIVQQPVVDGGVTDDPTPTLKGRSEAGARIRVYDASDTVIGDVLADSHGNWTVDTTPLPGDGTHVLLVTATDAVGNESAPVSHTVVLDTTAPDSVATIVSITEDTGIEGDFITSDQTLTIKGGTSQPPGADEHVQIRLDDGDWQEVTDFDPETGNWNYDAPQLGEGNHQIEARIIDKAGNISQVAKQSLIVDMTEPGAATVTIDGYFDDQGYVAGIITDNPSVTDDTMPRLHGSLTGIDVRAGDYVIIEMTDSRGTRILGRAQLTTDGTGWHYQVSEADQLQNGEEYSFRAIIRDVADNEGASADMILKVDLDPPATTASLTSITEDRGISDSDFITSDNTLIYFFTPNAALEAGETVWMRIKYASSGMVVTDWRQAILKDGVWQLDDTSMPRLDGIYEIEVHVRDRAGNSGASTSSVIEVDTTVQTKYGLSITTYTDHAGAKKGEFGSKTTTDDRNPTLNGIIRTPLAADEMIIVTMVSNGVTKNIGQATVAADGYNWSIALPDLEHDSSNKFTAQIVDIAGNKGRLSNDFTINVALSVNVDAQATTDTTPIITGAISFDMHSGEYVEVSVNGKSYSSQTGEVVIDPFYNSWYVQIPDGHELPLGSHDVVAKLFKADGSFISTDDSANELEILPLPEVKVGVGGNDPDEKATAVTMDENGNWMIFTNQAIMRSSGINNSTLGNFNVMIMQSQSGGKGKEGKSSKGHNHVHNGTWMDYDRDGYMDFFGIDSTPGNGQQAFINKGDGSFYAFQVGLVGMASGGSGHYPDQMQWEQNPDANANVWYGGVIALDKSGNGLTSLGYGDQKPQDPNRNSGKNSNGSQLVINEDGTPLGFAKDKNFRDASHHSRKDGEADENRFQGQPDMELSGVDLNNDGTIDIVFHGTKGENHLGGGVGSKAIRSKNDYRLVVASNKGDGTWEVPQIIENAFHRKSQDPDIANGIAMTWADFNGDGYMDLFMGRSFADIRKDSGQRAESNKSVIMFNDGDGHLGSTNINGIGTPKGIYKFNDTIAGGASLAVDWNHDGKMDIIELPTLAHKHHKSSGVSKEEQTAAVNLYTNTSKNGIINFTTSNLLSQIGLKTIGKQGDAVTGAVLIDVDWDGARDLLIFTQQGNTHYIHNENKVEYGTSLHFKILDSEGINAFYGNTVQLYDSKGKLAGTQMINPQSGNQTNDSTALVDFYGLNPDESYTLVMFHHNMGKAAHIGGLVNIGGKDIANVNAAWTDIKAGEANQAIILTAEAGDNVANANKANGIVGTGYNDIFIATKGTDYYFGAGGTVTISGEKVWSAAGGSDIVDYRLAGDIALTIDLNITGEQNTGFNRAKFVGIEGLAGANGDDVFTGNGADNIFNGRGGNDTFNLFNGGKDTLLYEEIKQDDATGGNGHDKANGFTIGTWEATPDADRIDLKALLIGYTADPDGSAHYINGIATIDAGDRIGDYLSTVYDGKNTTLYIDRDGADGTFHSTALVTLNDINIDLATLLANHQIVV